MNGWSNADKILGKQNCDTFDKMTAASAMIVEKLTFGLVSAENLVDFGKWIVKDRKAEAAAQRAAEQRKLLAEQQALSIMKGQETLNESNDDLYKIIHSDQANDAVTNTFTALKKSGDLSEKEMNNIINQHVEISRRIETGEATGEDLTNYRNSLDILRKKLSKTPEKHKTELANLNDLIANVDELDAKRKKKLKSDNAALTHDGKLMSSVVLPSENEAKMKELRDSRT